MATLRPFRDYDEKDVVNLFAWSGTIPANRGTVVKINRGYLATDSNPVMLGSVAASYRNTVSQRWGAYATVAATTAGDVALGILLKDVRETDENGELLKFNPIKAAEMDVVLSGQAVPICTKGTFLYSGLSGSLLLSGVAAMTKVYVGGAGELTVTPTVGSLGTSASGGSVSGNGHSVGFALGGIDTNGCVLVKLNFVGL